MKTSILISITLCIFCNICFGQAKRKTTFKVLGGVNYIARTNFHNSVYQNAGVTTSEYHEKGKLGLSFEILSSFYLSREWRLNTGIIMDKKGYFISGAGIFASPPNILTKYEIQHIANYLGIPLEIEKNLFKTKAYSVSIDAGIAEQWKISSVESGEYLLNNQFTFLGGLNFIFPYRKIAFIAHPVFRYSPTQLESPLVGGSSPSVNAYSVGLELGVSF